MTRRERIEAKIEKRKQWAESRKRKEAQAWEAHKAVPLPEGGEPIKVGHHSEKRHRKAIERSHALAFKALEHQDMARHHADKAAGLTDQLDAIFSDDDNAVEALEARIAEREAERERIKAYNASCRKGAPDDSLLDDAQRKNIESIRKVCPYQLGRKGQMPAYVLSNLSGRIKTDRDRLARIKYEAARQQRAADAGGVLIAEAHGYATVTFAEKPERSIINTLKAAGFRWGGGAWNGKAERIPAEVRALVV